MVLCSAEGCVSKAGGDISIFRCPKDDVRCQSWKTALGFIGTHRYANLSPEQCNSRIKICSLHFAEGCIIRNDSRTQLTSDAVPTLNLLKIKGESSCGTCAEKQAKSCKDVSVSTDIEEKVVEDKSTQTTMALSANSPRKKKLMDEIKYLKKIAKSSQSRIAQEAEISIEDVHEYLDKNFSEQSSKLLKSQLNLLNKSPRGCRYTDEFKRFAFSVYCLGPKVYKKFSTLYRLPSRGTLNRFTRGWIVNPGFNDFIFRQTEFRARHLGEKEKDCFLCLDETSLKSHLFYEISRDKIVGFEESYNSDDNNVEIARSALVVMARGIAGGWKQPIAYFFYKSTAPSDEMKDIIFESVRRLKGIGLNVLGVVSGQGTNFQKLVRRVLKLTEYDVSFFVDDIRLVYLFDVPQLLKSTRNNFFAYNFVLPEGIIKKTYLDFFYDIDKSMEYRLCPKLTDEHIHPNNFQKNEVDNASQVFSHSVAVAMHTYIGFNILPADAKVTANFIETMNNLFDLLNTCHLNNVNAFKGTPKQIDFLDEFESLLTNLIVVDADGKNVTNKMKFILGWKITIKSIKALWDTLKSRKHTFLLTRNLNQDCIENFFGQVRNCSGIARKPTAVQFSRAFKKLYSLRYFDQDDGANCMDDIIDILLNIRPGCDKSIFPVSTPINNSLKVFTTDYRNLSSTEGNALVCFAGYLLKKCLEQHSCQVCSAFNEGISLKKEAVQFCNAEAYVKTEELPCGSSTVPSLNIVEHMMILENIFIENFDKFARHNYVGTILKDLLKNVTFTHPCENFPLDYFVSLYTRVRIYYTLKYANRDIKNSKTNKSYMKLTILQKL